MQEQEKTNWCWAASGNTIATYFGRNNAQNEFCNPAFNRAAGQRVPEQAGDARQRPDGIALGRHQPGSYVSGRLHTPTVQTEIDAGRPIESRIQWSRAAGTCT